MNEPSLETVYQRTVERLELDITAVDADATLVSIAISLKRIADVVEGTNAWGEQGFALIARAVTEQLRGEEMKRVTINRDKPLQEGER